MKQFWDRCHKACEFVPDLTNPHMLKR